MLIRLPGRLIALAMVVVVVAAGLCLLDGDEPGGVDPCVIPLAANLMMPLVLPLPLAGRSLPSPVMIGWSYARDLPPPPPKA